MATELPDVCVVTHPLGSAGENATRTLLGILDELTAASLVTADLPDDSVIRERHPTVELTRKSAGQSNVPVAAVRYLLNQLRMCRAIAHRDETVVLFFGATSYLLPILYARLVGKTVVVEPRGDVPLTLRLQWEQQVPAPVARTLAAFVGLLERLAYRVADAVVAYTPSMADQLELDRYDEKLYTNGARYVDTERFQPTTPYEDRERVVGFLGRLDEEKGVERLATVARALPDDITFRFVGDGNQRPWLATELEDEIEAGSVELVGWVDHEDVPDHLSELRLLVLLSRPTEGLPTVALEAMACGTPVLATPVAGVPDVVVPDETGYLVDGRDPVAIAAEIERILESEPVEARSRTCRALAEREYSFDAAVQRYRTILSDLEKQRA